MPLAAQSDQTFLHGGGDQAAVSAEKAAGGQARGRRTRRATPGRRAATRRRGTAGGTTSRGRARPSCRRGSPMWVPCGRTAAESRVRSLAYVSTAACTTGSSPIRSEALSQTRDTGSSRSPDGVSISPAYRTSSADHSRSHVGAGPAGQPGEHVAELGTLLRRRRVGHRVLVLEPLLRHLERRRHVEDRPVVLAGDDAPGAERPAVAGRLGVVEDRDGRVAGPQEVGVQRVHDPVGVDRAGRGDQGLAGDLPAEDPLQGRLRLAPAEDPVPDRLEVEQGEQLLGRLRHGCHGGASRGDG